MGPSSGPDVQLFERFRHFLSNVKKAEYTPGIQDVVVGAELDCETQQRNFSYATEQLEIQHPRDDYRELLKLTVIFL